MRNWIKLIVVVAACTAMAGCARQGPKKIDDYAGVVHESVLAKAGLQYYWTVKVRLDEGERIERIYRLDENLYCRTSENRMIAVSAARGVPKWSCEVGKTDETVFRPAHADAVVLNRKPLGIGEMLHPGRIKTGDPFNAVFINTVHYVLVLDRTTGEQIRKIPLNYTANSGGASDGERFYGGGINGLYHATKMQEEVFAWTISTEDMISAPVERFATSVYVGSLDGTLYASRAGSTRGYLWRQQMTAPITTAFHVDERACFVPCDDGRLFALDPHVGSRLEAWGREPFVCQGPLRTPVQVSRNSVFQYAFGDKFYAINLANGKQRWALPAGRKVLAVMGGDVYLLDARRQLRIVDEMLGTTNTSLPMTGFDLFLPNTSAPAIYTAKATGRLYCIRLESAGYMTPKMLHPAAGKPAKAKAKLPPMPKPKPKPKPPAAPAP